MLTDELASIWFEQSFQDDKGNHVHVVFVKLQTLDKDGKTKDYHTAAPTIGAVTYKMISGMWEPASKQKEIIELGSWGEAPAITQAEVIQLAPGNPAFLINMRDSGQGVTAKSAAILGYIKNEWRYLGSVETSGDNSGSCDDPPNGQRDPNGPPPCWAFDGVVSIVSGKNPQYSDILVKRTGSTPEGPGGKIIPAFEIKYAFDGEQYVDAKQLAYIERLKMVEQSVSIGDRAIEQEAKKMGLQVPVSKEHFQLLYPLQGAKCDTNKQVLELMNAVADVASECELPPPCEPSFDGITCKVLRVGFNSAGLVSYFQVTFDDNQTDSHDYLNRFEKIYGRDRRTIKEDGIGNMLIGNSANVNSVKISWSALFTPKNPRAIIMIYGLVK